MFELAPVLQAVDEMIVTPGPMIFPPIVFGVITLVVLVALMGVTFAFRNTAASHDENPRIAKYEPVGHPGEPYVETIEGEEHTDSIEAGAGVAK